MRTSNDKHVLTDFFHHLKKTPHRALLCDYDGTLAPFKVNRNEAVPYAGIPDVLEAILASGQTRLVVISGRGLDDIISLLGMTPLPEIWGSHGGERLLQNGRYDTAAVSVDLARELETIGQWMADHGWRKLLEKKPMALALHWRGLKESAIQDIRRMVAGHWQDRLNPSVLTLHEFDGGLEFRPPGISKADAVNAILNEMPEGTVSAYLGDDMTDEDAFRAIKGRGLSILMREEMRTTSADVWLRPPDELLEFLWQWEKELIS